MKVGIVGSRIVDDPPIQDGLDRLVFWQGGQTVSHIISGGQTGVDEAAERYARAHEIPWTVFPAQLTRFGSPSAFKVRNQQIVRAADVILAFPIPTSRGTYLTIAITRAARKPLIIGHLDPPRRPRWEEVDPAVRSR